MQSRRKQSPTVSDHRCMVIFRISARRAILAAASAVHSGSKPFRYSPQLYTSPLGADNNRLAVTPHLQRQATAPSKPANKCAPTPALTSVLGDKSHLWLSDIGSTIKEPEITVVACNCSRSEMPLVMHHMRGTPRLHLPMVTGHTSLSNYLRVLVPPA